MRQRSIRVAVVGMLALLSLSGHVRADEILGNFRPVVLRAGVLDRHERPLSGVRVEIEADLTGIADDNFGERRAVNFHIRRTAATDASGKASSIVQMPDVPHAWFCGSLRERVRLIPDVERPLAVLVRQPVESEDENAPPTVRVFEEPDRMLDGFPVWTGSGDKLDKIVVALEGFDLYNSLSASDSMALLAPAGDALRAAGVSILFVDFPDSHLTPDALAPVLTRAIQAAAKASGQKVAVAAMSAGGLTARWALVATENAGQPLPVSELVMLDTPQRGGNVNPGLLAMIERYGKPRDKEAVSSPAALALIAVRPAHVRWHTVGLPGAARQVPVAWEADTCGASAFFDRLHHLNDRNGYPRTCRLVAVSSGSRVGGNGAKQLLHLWLPWNSFWTLPASDSDKSPGSVLPQQYVSAFSSKYPLGLAGAFLAAAPTFIPTASALDAGPGETPRFDAWYARPDNAPPIAHDVVDLEEGAFVVRELLEHAWQTSLSGSRPRNLDLVRR